MVAYFGYVLVLMLLWAGVRTLRHAGVRTAAEVADGLSESDGTSLNAPEGFRLGKLKLSTLDPLCKIGLYEGRERARYEMRSKLIPILFPLVCLVLLLLHGESRVPNLLIPTMIAWAVGYLFQRAKYRADCAAFKKTIDFYLPIVMERIIMAVQTGHDVLSAVRTVVELDDDMSKRLKDVPILPTKDPATRLFGLVLRFVEAGIKFDLALQNIADLVDSPALKHAFLHIKLAYLEGGAVIVPLRELSDSTQLFYQESIEEEIAKLPAKATWPLVITFAGLIIWFLTTPLVEIISISTKAQQTAGGQ